MKKEASAVIVKNDTKALNLNKRKKLPEENAKPNIAARRLAFRNHGNEVFRIPFKKAVRELSERTAMKEEDIKLILSAIKKVTKEMTSAGYLVKIGDGYLLPEEKHRTERKRRERKGRSKGNDRSDS